VASGSITLRPAGPTLDEGREYARYLDTAADGFFRLMLGRRMEQIVAEAYTKPGHDLSSEHVTFAEYGGSIAGMACGYTAEQHRESSDEPLTRAAGKMRALRMGIVTTLGRRVLQFIETVPDGDFYLQAVAVDDDRRGHGIGSMLIDQLEEFGRAQGCTRIVLDVAADNDGARRLYERRGMAVEAESPRMRLAPGMTALRMVKSL
jgi:ribosomal protein S18 acetylase RimI-like enzyme